MVGDGEIKAEQAEDGADQSLGPAKRQAEHRTQRQLRARCLPAQQGEASIAVEVLNRMIRVAKPVSVRAA